MFSFVFVAYGGVETLNVWTHLLGSFAFGVLIVCSLMTWLEKGDALDITVFLIYGLSAQLLLFLSSFFHLFYCMSRSPSEYSWFARLDYIGIAILICKAPLPLISWGLDVLK